MLSTLSIKNYAIIEEVEFNFNQSLNIITGETGAGKSIVLGALNMILGARADTKILYDQNRKCVVEATFDVSQKVEEQLAKQDDFDLDSNQVIIRREINNKGKSRAFINDTPVTLSILKNVGISLINLHQQFDTLDINDPNKQREYIDALANNTSIKKEYAVAYSDYKKIQSELKTLKKKGKQSAEELDYLKFQLNELIQADLDGLDIDKTESEYQSLNNAEDIKRVLTNFSFMLSEAEINVYEQLTDITKELLPLAQINPKIAKIKNGLEDISEELLNLQREADDVAEETEYDEEKVQELRDRLDLVYSLQKKHSKPEISSLIELRESIDIRIQNNDDLDGHIAKLENQLNILETTLGKVASKLSLSRQKVAAPFCSDIEKILHTLSMPNANMEIRFEELTEYEAHGRDNITYIFSANRGIPLNPISQIASGGELSRLALCIKSIIADKTNLPTMIFDEVDSGVSGQVALIMGQLIGDLSNKYQIITITHSPQVAAHGENHFFIYKEDRADRTITKVKKLSQEERVNEIAQMLGGESPSEAAISNAKELLEMAI